MVASTRIPSVFLPLSELNAADVNEACEGIHAVMDLSIISKHLKTNVGGPILNSNLTIGISGLSQYRNGSC